MKKIVLRRAFTLSLAFTLSFMIVVAVGIFNSKVQAEEKAAPKPPEAKTSQQSAGETKESVGEKDSRFGIPKFFTTSPPFTPGIFPCSNCHATMVPNKQRRELMFHQDIVLNHATKQRWCLDCHDANNRDKLKLANGDLIPFEELYFLCGQCHGNILRDWKVGIHGKRIGYWNGEKQYYLCVNCHSPHSPRFKPIKPLPMPARPHSSDVVKETTSVDIEGKKIYIPVYK